MPATRLQNVKLRNVKDLIGSDALNGNGHGIFLPRFYADRIAPIFISDIEALVRDHEVFENETMSTIKGVYSLDFHFFVAKKIKEIVR